jgi:hypothetical protein
VTEIGTCSECGHRFACIRLAASGALVVMHHNDRPKQRCPGAGSPPIEGSLTYQVAGRAITRDVPG